MAEPEKIDDYELINCVSTGSATQIWEVKPPTGTKTLAMKILLPEAFKDAEEKRSLKHEATVGKSLEHPNIIRIQDLKMAKKHAYFIMEYFRGANMKGQIRNEFAQTQARLKKVMECLAQALAYMHEKNWIHKDIKPDNVLVTKGGEVRLIDFSLASRPGSAIAMALKKKKNIVIQGTRTYLAPELIRRERLTPSADMYSLGVLLFEALTGNPPFRTANPNDLLIMQVRDKPATPSTINENVSPEADQLVARMLAKQIKERPANMNELFAELRNIKLFKRDPVELEKETNEKIRVSDAQTEHDRLNSRLDAERSASGVVRPAPKPKPAPPVLKPEPVKEKPAQAPVAAMGQPPFPYPPQPMGYPGMMPPPGMPMPGYPQQPGMPPMPGYPPHPGMPMGGFPGYPGAPMGAYPGMPFPPPGGQMPGQMPGMPGQPMPGFPPQQLPPGAPVPVQPVPVPIPVPAQVKQPESAADLPVASIDDLQIE